MVMTEIIIVFYSEVLQDVRVLSQELDEPSEGSCGGVMACNEQSQNVVLQLCISQLLRVLISAVLSQKRLQEIILHFFSVPPLLDHPIQHLIHPVSSLRIVPTSQELIELRKMKVLLSDPARISYLYTAVECRPGDLER